MVTRYTMKDDTHMVKKTKEVISAEMDAAAEVAKKDLGNYPGEAFVTVARWWKANYMGAGHKRLGRILASIETGEVKASVSTPEGATLPESESTPAE